jgi:hypothetical protein
LHVAPAASIPNLRHIELFVDHERIERLLFDGAPVVDGGQLRPSQEPGNGLRLTSQAERFRT